MKRRVQLLTTRLLAVMLAVVLSLSVCMTVYAEAQENTDREQTAAEAPDESIVIFEEGSEEDCFDTADPETFVEEDPEEDPEEITNPEPEDAADGEIPPEQEESKEEVFFDPANGNEKQFENPEPEDGSETEQETALFEEEGEESHTAEAAYAGVGKGTVVSGTFAAVPGMDVTTIRYFTNVEKTACAFAEFNIKADGSYEYSFTAPYDGFVKTEASETPHGGENIQSATVIAAYYDLNTWDGAVDVSWYDPELSEYHLYTPAEFAGLAAIVNGSIDSDIGNYNVKGYRSSLEITEENRGLPDCIECVFEKDTDLGGPVSGPCYVGLEKNDFLNKTVYLEADLYMGGTDGSVIDAEKIYDDSMPFNGKQSVNLHDGNHAGYEYYPNWTPIGGLFLTDLDDLNTVVKGAFNGVLEGNGHYIYNLYCYRWSYPKKGTTAYGYADSTGVIGRLGYLYTEDEGKKEIISPAVRNLGLTGFVMGRRSVGGIVGRAGGGSYFHGSIYLENLANHAVVYATDSKGVGGICGTFWNVDEMEGQILKYDRGGAIINCYNTGNIRQCEYDGPAGGIIGENNSADMYCCYNMGDVSSVSKKGRGIGANDSGKHYTVADCYYLEDHYDCDIAKYFGYYFENADSSISIDIEKMSLTNMKNGRLLALLNVNGLAYFEGGDGLPVLAWEAGEAYGSLSFAAMEGGIVSGSLEEGSYPLGTVVYLSNTTEEGWRLRYYTLNEEKLRGSYVSVGSDTVVSGFCQRSGIGHIELPNNPICDVHVFRVTGDEESGIEKTELKNGDPVREGDDLAIEATVREGLVPSDPDYEYREAAGVEQPFLYTITYSETKPETTYVKSIVVSSAINGEDVAMRIDVEALTVQKFWKNFSDTDWYEKERTEFTITSAKELAGIDKLVEDGTTDFHGVTITLGSDISLLNSDGSAGRRYWDGIGNASAGFAGTFDGAGHRITDINGSQYGLFAKVSGKGTNDRAEIRNVSVYGSMSGYNASGIAGYTAYADIKNCSNYCVIDGSGASGSSYSGGIVGYETLGCTISSCVNYAPVAGGYRTGGIVGESSGSGSKEKAGKMTDCLNFGNVTVEIEKPSVTYAGGLAGVYKGEMLRCANYGNVRSSANYTGGLAGYMTQSGNDITAKMTDCYNAGNVYAFSTQDAGGAGGLIGSADRFVLTNCFLYGTVEGAEDNTAVIGSFAGRYKTNDNNKTTRVYLLDTACEIIVSGYLKDAQTGENVFKNLTYAELAALGKSDVAGIFVAEAAAFAAEDGVLDQLNQNSSFVLTNALYPELLSVSRTHVHFGGVPACSEQAVCEDCGLHYGPLDPDHHTGTEIRNRLAAEWMQDGYTGDIYCSGCGELLEEGEIIPVDKTIPVITVSVTDGENVLAEKTYSTAEFDALAQTETVGYQFGNTSGVTSDCLASDRYVTLEALLSDFGYSMNDLVTAEVTTVGYQAFEKCTRETLLTRNLYVDGQGIVSTVPAAIGIYYNRQHGFAEDVVKDTILAPLIFMTGLSSEDIEKNSVGGFRLITPVDHIEYTVKTGRQSIEGVMISGVEEKTYSGTPLTQEPVVKMTVGGVERTLEPEKDYLISYRNNTEVGEAQMEIIGTGDFTGTALKTFTIRPMEIEPEIEFAQESFVYNGRKFTPQVIVTCKEKTFSPEEYDVTYPENAVNAGSYEVVVTMKGSYTGTGRKQLVIEPLQAEPEISLNGNVFSYNGREQKPAVTLRLGDRVLSADEYDLEWPKDSTNAGSYKVTATLTGNYAGTASAEYGISKAAQSIKPNVSALTLSAKKTGTVKVSGAKGTVTFKSSDPSIASVNKNSGLVTANRVGTAEITITAEATQNYTKNTAKVTVRVTPGATASLTAENLSSGIRLKWKKVDGAKGYYITRNGKSAAQIKNGTTVTWTDKAAAGNGTKYVYKITAYAGTGTSSLSKSVTTYFVKQPALSSVKSPAAKQAVLKWAKNKKATGYQICYSQKSNPSSKAKPVTIAKASTVSKTLTGLTSKKTYYIQIRTYKKVGKTTYWSAWSAQKKVKIK